MNDIFPEGYEREHGKFHGLYPERDPDNGDKEQNTGYNVHQENDQSPENNPDDISDKTQLSNYFGSLKLWNFHLQNPCVYQI
jgi:hypothetical protein